MEKSYQPKNIETSWYQHWSEHGYFSATLDQHKENYCIMLPPPNVTGSLHMGHAFQQTLMDTLVRYHRMRGKNTLWQCGTDHAGIATQMLVEQRLNAQGQSRLALGRDRFIKAVWDWKKHSGNTIEDQCRRLGISVDWARACFTMDPDLSATVTTVFIKLYEEGLIYRGKRLVNWDPVLHTAISDLEVITEEEDGQLWYIRYPRIDADGYLVVATTRPETMLGDTAIAVHPDDCRYQDVIGKKVRLPLLDKTITVIADAEVDPTFGSGCVKITPAHDFNDYKIGQRHNLPQINIFTVDASINENAPVCYQGLDRYIARQKIVTDLKAAGLLEKIVPHKMAVPRGDRSHAVIEPYLTDQWYVKIQPLATPAIEAIENGSIKFIPENWSKTYFEWMRHIEDWCISRQLWWGHRIPAWYDEDGAIYVAEDEAAVRKKYRLADTVTLRQDEDVLDTWFSSALWPFSTLGWPKETKELAAFYPTNVLVTGFDIIFFWVARMIMMGLKLTGDIPFKEVYIHGLVRDHKGQKMSKSKGNILDPVDLINGIDLQALVKKRTANLLQPRLAAEIERETRALFPQGITAYGADPLRFTFASLATRGRDIRFDVGRIQGYRNFCNKLWNAARYVLLNIEQHDIDINDEDKKIGPAEYWIHSQLSDTIKRVEQAFKTYRFDLAATALYDFTWGAYCDWYLECSKTVLNDATTTAASKRGTLYTLVQILECLLRLLHPLMPFITETIWQRCAVLLNINAKTIMLQPYPRQQEVHYDEAAVAEFEWVKTLIIGVRKIRAGRDIAPGKSLAIKVSDGSDIERTWLDHNTDMVQTLGKISSITTATHAPTNAATTLVGTMTVSVSLADLIDPVVELQRLTKEIDQLQGRTAILKKKMDNQHFVQRAPKAIIDKTKQELLALTDAIRRLEKQRDRVHSLED